MGYTIGWRGFDPAFSNGNANSGRRVEHPLHVMNAVSCLQALYGITQCVIVKMFRISLSLGLGLMQHGP